MDIVHKLKQKVYYADTDAYGVVWHGSYIRWLEMGRVAFCDDIMKLSLVDMQNNDVVLPVVSLSINYKSPAKLSDDILIETRISSISKLSIVFEQVIRNPLTDNVYITAEIKVVAVNNSGVLYRKLPDILTSTIKELV